MLLIDRYGVEHELSYKADDLGIDQVLIDGEVFAIQGAWGQQFSGWHNTAGDWATVADMLEWYGYDAR